jgi:hypothetical protein
MQNSVEAYSSVIDIRWLLYALSKDKSKASATMGRKGRYGVMMVRRHGDVCDEVDRVTEKWPTKGRDRTKRRNTKIVPKSMYVVINRKWKETRSTPHMTRGKEERSPESQQTCKRMYMCMYQGMKVSGAGYRGTEDVLFYRVVREGARSALASTSTSTSKRVLAVALTVTCTTKSSIDSDDVTTVSSD